MVYSTAKLEQLIRALIKKESGGDAGAVGELNDVGVL